MFNNCTCTAAASSAGGAGVAPTNQISSANNDGYKFVKEGTDAEEEARKQMMGRNTKKATGRLAASGRKNYANIKSRMKNVASYHEHNCHSFVICTLVVSIDTRS